MYCFEDMSWGIMTERELTCYTRFCRIWTAFLSHCLFNIYIYIYNTWRLYSVHYTVYIVLYTVYSMISSPQITIYSEAA